MCRCHSHTATLLQSAYVSHVGVTSTRRFWSCLTSSKLPVFPCVGFFTITGRLPDHCIPTVARENKRQYPSLTASAWGTPTACVDIRPFLKTDVLVVTCVVDKSLIVWRLTRDESSYGVPQKSLHGHGHFVSDVILSSDGQFALSGSWDHTLRLWDLSRCVLCNL